MPVKRLKAKTAAVKSARPAVKTARKAKAAKPELSIEEVTALEQQLARHKQSEAAWQRLAAPPEGDDRWAAVEEHLLHKDQAHDHAERRWKYFSK